MNPGANLRAARTRTIKATREIRIILIAFFMPINLEKTSILFYKATHMKGKRIVY